MKLRSKKLDRSIILDQVGDNMDDSTYEVKSLEQMKAISSKIRIKILNVMDDYVPRTNKQIADQLGIPASKVHYHVRELERVGLLRLVDTREKGGVMEKYYLPVAKHIKISWADKEETMEQKRVRKQMGQTLTDELFEAYRKALDEQERIPQTMGYLYMKKEEVEELHKEMREVFRKWMDHCQEPNEDARAWRVFLTVFPDE